MSGAFFFSFRSFFAFCFVRSFLLLGTQACITMIGLRTAGRRKAKKIFVFFCLEVNALKRVRSNLTGNASYKAHKRSLTDERRGPKPLHRYGFLRKRNRNVIRIILRFWRDVGAAAWGKW